MKRLFSLLLLCALLSALAAPALADVAYIPTNDFLEKHQQDYEARKAEWLRKKAHLPKQRRTLSKPDGD